MLSTNSLTIANFLFHCRHQTKNTTKISMDIRGYYIHGYPWIQTNYARSSSSSPPPHPQPLPPPLRRARPPRPVDDVRRCGCTQVVPRFAESRAAPMPRRATPRGEAAPSRAHATLHCASPEPHRALRRARASLRPRLTAPAPRHARTAPRPRRATPAPCRTPPHGEPGRAMPLIDTPPRGLASAPSVAAAP